ncbi:DUF3006 domain-containing protein [Desulfitobacterium sp. Sab5]|uniref:DUF3006 domain-containing protein n=1 Tax=Desulfitobacterium nosdiversum TaxID=3375356 RepID=UPI003CED1BA4
MKGIIDRFEGDLAVIETEERQIITIQRRMLPPGVCEGDAVYEEDGVYRIDMEETKHRKEEIKTLMNRLWK